MTFLENINEIKSSVGSIRIIIPALSLVRNKIAQNNVFRTRLVSHEIKICFNLNLVNNWIGKRTSSGQII